MSPRSKNKKIHTLHPPPLPLKKHSLYLRKGNFLALILKERKPIFSKESLSYISGNGTLHFSPQAVKIKEIHPEKISCILGNENPEKISYIPVNENPQKIPFVLGNG